MRSDLLRTVAGLFYRPFDGAMQRESPDDRELSGCVPPPDRLCVAIPEKAAVQTGRSRSGPRVHHSLPRLPGTGARQLRTHSKYPVGSNPFVLHLRALQEPSAAAVAQRVLAIKSKRCPKKPVDFLTRAESDAVLSGPDQTTWSGRRDRTLLLVALQTGLRHAATGR